MRKFLAFITAAALLLFAGCAQSAQSTANEQSAAGEQPAAREEAPRTQQAPPANAEGDVRVRRPAQNGGNMLIGKIVSVSGNEITVELAELESPGRGAPEGERPSRGNDENRGDGGRQERSRPDEGERPAQGERSRPEGGFAGGGGRGFGGQTELTYSGKQQTYAITQDVKITSGMGEDSQTLAVTDLEKDEVVRLELDEDGNLVSINV